MNRNAAPPFQISHRIEWILFAAILLVAACTRLYQLDALPPGWTHDEAGHGHDAAAIAQGARPIYETVGYGREPLYDYVVAGLMTFTGSAGWALRLTSVLCGLATLWLTFAWARLAFDGPTALIAVALQAASFWSQAVSRQALRSTLLLALFTAAVTIYWRATHAEKKSSQGLWALFALLTGATLYTYLSARVMWVLFPAFLIYLALWQRATFRRVWFATLLALAIGWLLAAPMFLWLQQHPGAEQRLAMLDAPLQALRSGQVSIMLDRAASGLAAFFIPGRGDDFLAYTIPGRPLLDPLTAILFAFGVMLSLVHWRRPAYAFSILWFGVGIAPTLITGAPAAITRSITALPVTFLFPALAAAAAARWASARGNKWGARVSIAAWILVGGAFAARDYLAWGQSPDVRAAYQHTVTEIARYADAQPPTASPNTPLAISTVYPQAPHDPYVFELSLRRRDLVTRWFDARAALLIPSDATARLVIPASTPLAAYFADLPGLRQRDRVTLRPDDLDPFFVVYDWQPQVTLAALRARASGPMVDLGALQFIGYDLRTPRVKPGGTVELVTLWQVTDPQPVRDTGLVLFTHALNGAGQVVGQQDQLDAPAWSWRAGDVIAQFHRFTLPANLAAASLALEVGAYKPTDLTRLPVLVNGVAVDNRVMLQPLVEIK